MDTTLNRTAERVARLIEGAEVLDPLATGVVRLSAWLGGHLTYARGVGVRAGTPGVGGAGQGTTA